MGSVGAACSGAALPVFAYLFGQIVNNIGGLSGATLISNVNQTVLYFVYLAIATFVASYLEMALWMLSGELLQMNPCRHVRKDSLSPAALAANKLTTSWA